MDKVWELKNLPNYYLNEFENFEYKQHKEDKVIVEDKENAKYEFHIKDVNDNILYSKGYIAPELKIIKQNGSSVGEDNVTLVNTGNLFSRSELHIGKTLVEEIENPSLVHHVNGLINFTKDYAHSEATNMLYYIDTSDSPDKQYFSFDGAPDQSLGTQDKMNTFLEGLKPNSSYNDGFFQRWKITKNSNKIKLWIPLKQLFGFFNDFGKLISNIDVRFVFQRNGSNDMLYTNVANPNYKVTITDVSLWLPHIKLYPDLQAHYMQAALNDVEINWCSTRLIRSNVIDNRSSGSLIVNTTSDELRSVFVIPQYIEKENDQSQNSMIFDNLEMIRCYLRINNDKYPNEDYTVSFKDSTYSRYYSDFLAAGLNNINTESGCLVSYTDYGNLYPIIHFDVSNHSAYNSVDNLKIEFYWYLRKNTTKPYRFYFILVEKRKGVMNMHNKKFDILRTLA